MGKKKEQPRKKNTAAERFRQILIGAGIAIGLLGIGAAAHFSINNSKANNIPEFVDGEGKTEQLLNGRRLSFGKILSDQDLVLQIDKSAEDGLLDQSEADQIVRTAIYNSIIYYSGDKSIADKRLGNLAWTDDIESACMGRPLACVVNTKQGLSIQVDQKYYEQYKHDPKWLAITLANAASHEAFHDLPPVLVGQMEEDYGVLGRCKREGFFKGFWSEFDDCSGLAADLMHKTIVDNGRFGVVITVEEFVAEAGRFSYMLHLAKGNTQSELIARSGYYMDQSLVNTFYPNQSADSDWKNFWNEKLEIDSITKYYLSSYQRADFFVGLGHAIASKNQYPTNLSEENYAALGLVGGTSYFDYELDQYATLTRLTSEPITPDLISQIAQGLKLRKQGN